MSPLPVLVAVLVLAGSAGGAERQRMFPLADGNRWTLRDVENGAALVITVRRERAGLVLRSFPGLPDLRVRSVGQTVEAWDSVDARWEDLFRFGASTGAYRVDLGGTALWRNVRLVVDTKRAVVYDYNDKARSGGVRFKFRYAKLLADAGLEEIAFAPGVGPVRISEQTIAGTRERALAAYRVRPPTR